MKSLVYSRLLFGLSFGVLLASSPIVSQQLPSGANFRQVLGKLIITIPLSTFDKALQGRSSIGNRLMLGRVGRFISSNQIKQRLL